MIKRYVRIDIIMNFLSLFFLSLFGFNVFGQKATVLEFNSRNLITIRGPIQGSSSTGWISQMNDRDPDTDTMYLYLSSPGGSVLEGQKLVDQIKTMQQSGINVVCVADFAASMAFVILQSCPKRMALPSSVLMQHQMSLGLDGPLENVNNYLDFIHQINENLESMQAERLNMTVTDFKQKVVNDWWIPGHNAKNVNAVDELVMVKCSKEILTKREKITLRTFFGNIEIYFSKCPIAREPIEVKYPSGSILNEFELEDKIKYYVPSIYIREYTANKKTTIYKTVL